MNDPTDSNVVSFRQRLIDSGLIQSPPTSTPALSVTNGHPDAPPDSPLDPQRAKRWLERKLEGDLQTLLQTPAGQRNHTLNAIAYSLGKFVPTWLDEQTVERALYDTGLQVGLSADEMLGRGGSGGTIRSGLRSGMREPRDPPIRPDQLTAPLAPATQLVDVDPVTGEMPPPRESAPFPRLDLSLLGERCPDPVWLVTDRITAQSLTLIGSKPGIGKSWTAYDLAIALTSGRDWLGHAIPERRRVLYIDVENGETLARKRLQQLGATPELVGDRLYYVTEPVMFPGGRDSQRYEDTLRTFQPDLVILDTLASAAPSAEKGTEEASLLMSDVWHRARAAGAGVLILAHLRKSQQGAGKDDPLDSFRGAGHLGGVASTAWVLETRGKRRFAMRTAKVREDMDMPTIRIVLTDTVAPDGHVVDKLTRLEVDGLEYEDDNAETPFLRFQRRVLEHIDAHPTGAASTAALLTLGDGETDKTLRNYLYEMKKAGIVESRMRGQYSRPGTRL